MISKSAAKLHVSMQNCTKLNVTKSDVKNITLLTLGIPFKINDLARFMSQFDRLAAAPCNWYHLAEEHNFTFDQKHNFYNTTKHNFCNTTKHNFYNSTTALYFGRVAAPCNWYQRVRTYREQNHRTKKSPAFAGLSVTRQGTWRLVL